MTPGNPTEKNRTHNLKVWPEFFVSLVDGSKPFEIRRNDRGFRVGDSLILEEFVPDDVADHPTGKYTGRTVARIVTYVSDWEQRENIVVLGLGYGRVRV